MIKSRLRDRRVKLTIDVKEKTLVSGQYSESTVSGLGALVATREQAESTELVTDAGALVNISDTLWFEAIAGNDLPAIEEKHVLVDGDSVRYEAVSVQNMGGEQDRLKVMCRRLR